jgi:CheY-like chemotaxis protein
MQHLRALVVDDSKVGRITLMKILEPLGLRVELAESGVQALEMLTRGRPDMIFMDHMMPDMDGFEVTRRIKASPATRDIPVIIVSGNEDAAFVQEARQAGALDAIAKPPPSGVLERLIASLPAPSAAPAPEPEPATPALGPEQVRALVQTLLEEAMARARAEFTTQLEGERARQADSLAELQRQASEMARLGERLQGLEHSLHHLETRIAAPTPDAQGLVADLEARIGGRQAEQSGALADMGRRLTDLAGLEARVPGLEQRLQSLEAQAAVPGSDVAALGAGLEQRVAAALDELRARDPAPLLETLRQDLLARLDDRAGQAEARSAGLDGRLEGLSGDVGRLLEELREARSTLDGRIGPLEEAIEAVLVNPPAGGAESAGAGGEEIAALRAELAQLRERLNEPAPQPLVAEAASGTPAAPATPVEESDTRAELARLRDKLGRLTTLTLVGGTVLLFGVVYLLF